MKDQPEQWRWKEECVFSTDLYKNFLEDGGSKTCAEIAKANVYGDLDVKNQECTGHVQKHTGKQLPNVFDSKKGKQLLVHKNNEL